MMVQSRLKCSHRRIVKYCSLSTCSFMQVYCIPLFQVQSRAAGIELGVVMFSTLPSILSAIMIGAWTDKAGRRIGIALPCLGTMIDSLLMIIMIYKKWPLWTMFVGSAISGLCGYLTLLQVAIMAYIADTCNVSKLPLRIGEDLSHSN